MSLNAKQDDWSNLLTIESIDQAPPPDSIFQQLNADDRLELAAVWLSDGIHARHTDYPKTSKEVQYFKMSRSAYLRGIFNIAVIVQLLATFLDNTKCDHDYSNDGSRLFNPNGSPTRLTLTILDLMCLIVYLYELFLVFIVNPTRKSLTSKPWSTLRLLICLFVILDCLIYFIDPMQPRLMRCVFPFLLISKRNNLKLMCQGLIISAYKSLPIIKALVSILVLWGFIGYFFFNATDGNTTAFSNPGEGIAEALHCFTSRPYVMKSLDPIYSSNQASAMYFVSLTLAADILCIALIVATGAKHYKQFAGNILHNRLVDRRHAITCAFYAIADRSKLHNNETDEEVGLGMTVSRQIWVNLCSRMVGKYAPSTHTANFIYDLVINGDPRRSVEDREEGDQETDEDSGDFFPRKYAHNMDLYLFFRCCALVAARIVVQVEAPVQNPIELAGGRHNSLSQRLSSFHKDAALEQEARDSGRSSRVSTPAGDVLTVFSPCISSTTVGMQSDTSGSSNNTTAAAAAAVLEETRTTTPAVAVFEQQQRNSQDPSFDITMVSVDAHLDNSERTSTFRVLRVSEHPPITPEPPTNSIDSTPSSRPSLIQQHQPTLVRRLNDFADRVHADMLPIREACIHITGANVTVGGSGFVYTINVFHSINIFLILLLVIDLSYLSRPKKTLGWFAFVCFLEACFWLHLFVRIAAVGVRRFVTFYENRADSLMNLCSLIALVELGKVYTTDHYRYEGNLALGWFILIQALRLFKLFFAINDVRVFEHMRPVLIRASFIYFSIIYFFAIFGYSYFCHAMNVQDAQDTSPNNDANQWVQYANLLNFNTLLQSLFTLFELSILGNWSIVMDAAVASTSAPAGAYIFFYTFRLVITLFILPILLSFIIQVFLSALNARERDLKTQQEEEETTRFSLGQMGIFTQNPYVEEGGGAEETGRSTTVRRSSTKVSYNVNQEVITVPRRSSSTTVQQHKQLEEGGRESEQGSEFEETFSPIGSPASLSVGGGSTVESTRESEYSTGNISTGSGAGGGRKKRGSILDRSGRNAWSIRLGVDKVKAQNARDKFTESVTGVATGQPGQSYARPSEVSSVSYGSTGNPSVEHTAPEGMSLSALSTPARGRPAAGHHSAGSSSRGGSGHSSRDHSPPRGGDQQPSSKVTVQYDSKGASSMMSIWTIDGNDTPSSQNSARKGGGGVWGRSSGLPPSGSSHTAGGGNISSNHTSSSAASAELAHLRGRLEAALRQLEAEKNKNQSLREQAHLI